MDTPVTQTVAFKIDVTTVDRGDHWMARSQQTGIIAYGATEEDAVAALGRAQTEIVLRVKEKGLAALESYMSMHGVVFSINPVGAAEPSVAGELRALPLAA